MKYFNKLMVFFVFMLFGYGVDTFAYTYKITNKTNRDVKVQLYSTFGKLGHPRIIKSGSKHKFSFIFPDSRFGFCLYEIMVSTKDSAGKWGKGKKAEIVGYKSMASVGRGVWRLITVVPAIWDVSLCRNRNFVLGINEKSQKIVAMLK